jgi:hypothetical protein
LNGGVKVVASAQAIPAPANDSPAGSFAGWNPIHLYPARVRGPASASRKVNALDFALIMRKKSRQRTMAPAANIAPPKPTATDKPGWIKSWKVMVVLWLVMLGLAWMALSYNVDKSVIAGSVLVVGLVSNAFAWLLGIVALVPIIGPLIAKVLSIGFIWLLNAVGYLVSFIAIKRGYSRDVLTYRGVTIALIIGIVIGFVLGKLI